MRNLEKRLDRIEGMLVKLLIDVKVAQRFSDKAISTANAALIEIKAYKESVHEVKYVPRDEYNAAFQPSEDYGPTEVPQPHVEQFPSSLQDIEYDTDLSEFEA